jgi:hypothetical protein
MSFDGFWEQMIKKKKQKITYFQIDIGCDFLNLESVWIYSFLSVQKYVFL